MLRELLLALALVAVVVTVPALASAQATPGWSAAIANYSVPLGNPIDVQVMGPPNGSYAVVVNVQPFNSSAPAYANVSRLPATASLANGSALAEFQVPTANLGIETVMLTLTNTSGGTFATFYVALNDQGGPIEAQVQQLAYEQLVLNAREQSLLYTQGQYRDWMLFTVAVSLTATGANIALTYLTRTAAQEKRLVKAMKRSAARVTERDIGVSAMPGVDEPEYFLMADPRALFAVAPEICDACRIPRTRPAAFQHATEHGLSPEEANARVVASEMGERHTRDLLSAMRPKHAAATAHEAEAARVASVDLTDILGS